MIDQERKFKRGDLVRCIGEGGRNLKMGNTYVVGGYYYDRHAEDFAIGIINDAGKDDTWYTKNFEAVNGPW